MKNENKEWTLLGEFEEAPEIEYEPEYECPPDSVYLGPEALKFFMASYNSFPYKTYERPAPIEVEAEVIKTEIIRTEINATKGLLNESDH